MTVLPRLWDGDRSPDALLIPLLGIGQAFALGVGAFATRDAFEALHSGTGVPDRALLTLIAAGMVAAALDLIGRRRSEALGQSYACSLRLALYGHLAGMDRRAVSGRRLGALSLRFVGDLSAARNWFGRGLTRLVSAAVVLPGAGVVLYLLDPVLAATAAVPVVLSLAVMAALAVGLGARHRALRSRRANISIAMMERVAISPHLDLLERTTHELSALDENGAALRQNAVARVTRLGLVRLLPQAGAAVAGAGMLWVSGIAGIAPGSTAAGLAVLGILMIPLRDCGDVWDQFCAWRVAREKAAGLFAIPSHRREIVLRGRPVEVVVAGVVVGMRVVDMTVPAGALALLIGPQGSGKSELGHLIAGLDRTSEGTVCYDGKTAPLPRIAHIGDGSPVVQGSLRRGLTMGITPRPARRRIEEVSKVFGLGPLLTRLDGIRGRIGEAARTVSSAEALRIDLTRAALAAPDLIVIDSSRLLVDPDRETLLVDLRRLTDCTMLVIGASFPGVAFDATVDLAVFPTLVPVSGQHGKQCGA